MVAVELVVVVVAAVRDGRSNPAKTQKTKAQASNRRRLTSTGQNRGTFSNRIVYMLGGLVNTAGVDQWTNHCAVVQAMPNRELLYFLGEHGSECIVNIGLDVDTVGANAGLPSVSELCRHGSVNSGVQVSLQAR